MSEIDEKIEGCPDDHRALASRLRNLIHDEVDGVEEAVKWGNPTFVVGGTHLFYLADSSDHVKFGLFTGAGLSDPEEIVEGTGKKMRHVKVDDADSLDEDAIRGLVREARDGVDA